VPKSCSKCGIVIKLNRKLTILINTKQIIIASLLVVFAIGLFAVPQAFADHDEVTIENAAGSSTPGCEPECFIPSTVTIKADTEVTWENNDNAAHTATGGSATDGPSGVFDSSLIMQVHHFLIHLKKQEHSFTFAWFIHGWQEL